MLGFNLPLGQASLTCVHPSYHMNHFRLHSANNCQINNFTDPSSTAHPQPYCLVITTQYMPASLYIQQKINQITTQYFFFIRFKCYNLQYCPKNYFGWLSEGMQNYRLQLGILFGDTAIQTFCFMYCVFILAAKMVV